MARYRETMRLSALGRAPRAVAAAVECNGSTVGRVLAVAPRPRASSAAYRQRLPHQADGRREHARGDQQSEAIAPGAHAGGRRRRVKRPHAAN